MNTKKFKEISGPKNPIGFLRKRGQIALFVIIAILIAGAVAGTVYLITSQQKIVKLPNELQPAENYFVECIKSYAEQAIGIISLSGGYIELPAYDEGSEDRPFGNYLDFQGFEIPYWYYLSGNNLEKEQIPTIESMEKQINNYLAEKVKLCSFDELSNKGFVINYDKTKKAEVKTEILDNKINLAIRYPIEISVGDETRKVNFHSVAIDSGLGSSYELANKIYSKEKNSLFLENYTRDVLVLYLPNNDVEISCKDLTWNVEDVKKNFKQALEANIPFIKLLGNYYSLSKFENKYFVTRLDEDITNKNINFVYSSSWPMNFEVWPSDNGIMVAEAIGLQEEFKALGFCIVPYHFVYDAHFPVLIQITNEKGEMFQFPVIVSIDKSVPKKANVGEVEVIKNEICHYKNQEGIVNTYDEIGNPLENVKIRYKCISSICNIGETVLENNKASLNALFPKCVNGFLIAEKDGYMQRKIQLSSDSAFSTNLVLMKLNKLDFEIKVFEDGKERILKDDEEAIISFISENYKTTVFYPEQKEIELIPDIYEVKAYVFKKGNLELTDKTTQICVDVPAVGIAGIIGQTREECFEMSLPSQLENMIVGGGVSEIYIGEENLAQKKITVKAEYIGLVSSAEQIQDIYTIIDLSLLDLEFS